MQKVYNYIERWLGANSGQLSILEKLIKVVIIFVLIKIAIKAIYKLIDRIFLKQNRLKFGVEQRKSNTLLVILKSISKYFLYFVGIIATLNEIGIPTGSILATAGVGGLAISFGAQSLVKDIITGFFILFEDQFSVGDYIQTGIFDGIVEEIGLRVTKIRAFTGDLHIVPNGNIQTVTNRSRGAMRALVDVSIAYEEDIDNAIMVMNSVAKKMAEDNDNIIEGPTVLGVSSLGESDVVLTIIAKTKPMEQWSVERELRKAVKEAFDNNGIEIPYPRRVVINTKE